MALLENSLVFFAPQSRSSNKKSTTQYYFGGLSENKSGAPYWNYSLSNKLTGDTAGYVYALCPCIAFPFSATLKMMFLAQFFKHYWNDERFLGHNIENRIFFSDTPDENHTTWLKFKIDEDDQFLKIVAVGTFSNGVYKEEKISDTIKTSVIEKVKEQYNSFLESNRFNHGH